MSDRVTRQTYDEIAADFARNTANMAAEVEASLTRFLSLVGPDPHICDVGCGPGHDSFWMKQHSAHVVSVDLSYGMLLEAHTKGLRLAQMDLLRLGFPNRSFSGIWCCASMLHLSKCLAPDALAEFRRILTPGGVLFLALQEGEMEGYEQVPYRTEPLQRFFARYQMDEIVEMLIRSAYRVVEQHRYETEIITWLHVFSIPS